MRPLRITLLADGTSDKALVPIIEWQLRRSWRGLGNRGDLLLGPIGFEVHGGGDLQRAFDRAIERDRPDIVVVHRDAESVSRAERRSQIPQFEHRPFAAAIPVRMTEAWLMIDEAAIRKAAGNPNGSGSLDLPKSARIESVKDPKSDLKRLLEVASGLPPGRRLERFRRDLPARIHLVADYIESFDPLDELPSYREFADELGRALQRVSLASE